MTDKTHTHHILPLKLYLTIAGALFFLTIITVLVAQFHFGAWNIVVALGIAAIKGTLVGLYFMHLKYDNKLYMTIFVVSLLFLAVFIGFTMLDTMFRGEINPVEGPPIKENAIIYDQKQ